MRKRFGRVWNLGRKPEKSGEGKMKILVINPGSTSTKIAVFEEDREEFCETVRHREEELKGFQRSLDQVDFRKNVIKKVLAQSGYRLEDFSAVCSRGGLCRHIPSGTYEINQQVLDDISSGINGEHACNAGPFIAGQISRGTGMKAYFLDPVVTDELSDVARISGYAGMERESFFHALNHKSVARKAASLLGKRYEEVNLVIAHMGGGVSVAAHEKGRAVDVYNIKNEGAMGMDRCGSIPTADVIRMCYERSREEVEQLLFHQGGIYSYLGVRDFRSIEQKVCEGNREYTKIWNAFAYQIAKDIGAMAAALRFDVDAVVYTGGIAYSDRFCEELSSYVGALAPVIRIPGEEEMKALAEGALRVLRGEPAGKYESGGAG